MNRTETSVGRDLERMLAVLQSEPDGGDQEQPVPPETHEASAGLDGEANCPEEAAHESQMSPGQEHTFSEGPTAAEVGAHFATEITDEAEMSLQAAARLGPKRVLALLA